MGLRSTLLSVFATLALGVTGCSETDIEKSTAPFKDAMEAKEAGDTARAMDLLTQSIELQPTPWAFYERARLHLDSGDEAQAKEDVAAGLKADPMHTELKWLQQELAKPAGDRFKGRNAEPPRAVK